MDRVSKAAALAMSLRMERSAVLVANIANKDTPGYTPLEPPVFGRHEGRLSGRAERASLAAPDQGVGVRGEPDRGRGEVVFDPARPVRTATRSI